MTLEIPWCESNDILEPVSWGCTPPVRVQLSEHVGTEVVREVREGAADLGVVWNLVNARGLQTAAYRADHLGVVMPPSHPLSKRKRITFADTLEHASVGLSPGGRVAVCRRALAGGAPFCQGGRGPRVPVTLADAACDGRSAQGLREPRKATSRPLQHSSR